MKAEILGYIAPTESGLTPKEITRLENQAYMGDVDPLTISPDLKSYGILRDFAIENGFKPVYRPMFANNCILPLAGGVGWHKDEGIGLILNWVLHETPHKQDVCRHNMQLIYPNGAIDVAPGHVFVFNGNQGHAWHSNSRCVLVQMTVAKMRSKKMS
jgi:hypothetical protein